ncbi:hypothetical protein [Bradyrhizobium lablabi]|uniref:hypothetical protein n=1 Tax=Bradyrhizobium lablabi TaxID=722472 RepID=UPI001BA4846B|nr:hypothetical protein [Bradyrhizobium lablabi]MBR0693659.1 hypothetical protein [Bradyrhizobium lablabi]
MDDIDAASHKLCAALHMDGIDPKEIEILLPREAWWRMWTRLEQKHRGMMQFDGRGTITDRFRYMGITYRVKETKE